MPGPVSDSFRGRRGTPDQPYVPTWCYPNNSPRQCPCGHHEGFHNDKGECLQHATCGCKGLPAECRTPDNEF